jgi:hypothetical protein
MGGCDLGITTRWEELTSPEIRGWGVWARDETAKPNRSKTHVIDPKNTRLELWNFVVIVIPEVRPGSVEHG